MQLSIQYHAGNPNICRIPELKIGKLPECEGGSAWIPRQQAEALVTLAQAAFAWWEERQPQDAAERKLCAAVSALAELT